MFSLKSSLALIATSSAAVILSPFAHADDTLHPNAAARYCPGGSMETDISFICDGEGFGDGSFFRDIQFHGPSIFTFPPGSPAAPGLHCLANVRQGGSVGIAVAPPGSGACGGAA